MLHATFRYKLTAVFCVIVLTHCSPFKSNPVTKATVYPRALEKAKADKNYMVLHSGMDLYAVKYVEVEKANKRFTIMLDRIDSVQKANYAHFLARPNSSASQGQPLSQVHIFLKDTTSYTLDEPHTISFANITSIQRVQ